MANTVVRCARCGTTYTRAEFRTLPYVGKQTTPADKYGPEETIVMRNCKGHVQGKVCNSTLSVEQSES